MGQHVELHLVAELLHVGSHARLDHQVERVQGHRQRRAGRACQSTGMGGGQNIDTICTQRHRLRDRCVVGHSTVDQVASADSNRREHSRDRCARQQGRNRRAVGKDYPTSGREVGRDNVERNPRLLQAPEREISLQQTAQAIRAHKVIALSRHRRRAQKRLTGNTVDLRRLRQISTSASRPSGSG